MLPVMGYPRSHLVDPDTPGYFHCVSRCVRRAFLCGVDEDTGQDFEHRRQWIEDRIHHLAKQYAIGVLAYAVMSNHVHLVLATDPGMTAQWDDEEVVRRWRQVFPVRHLAKAAAIADGDLSTEPAPTVSPEIIAIWRKRLGSLSWFMRTLLEPIARRANDEDDCTGRFWEGRFHAQALLDERNLIAASVYVDLNPVRAGMVRSLEASRHTSVALRIAQQKAETAPSTVANAPAPDPHLAPVAGRTRLFDSLPMRLSQYLELVAWSGKVSIHALESAETSPTPKTETTPVETLRTLFDCDPSEWLEGFTAFRDRWRLAGSGLAVRKWLDQHQRHWMRRSKRRRRGAETASRTAETTASAF